MVQRQLSRKRLDRVEHALLLADNAPRGERRHEANP
jgi:hypothetical protein